jgi:hypothetical protein
VALTPREAARYGHDARGTDTIIGRVVRRAAPQDFASRSAHQVRRISAS